MTKQTTTHTKRILSLVLTIAIAFSLFSASVNADTGEAEAEINPLGASNGEAEPRQGSLGDSNIEEVKPEEVSLGGSGQETPAIGPAKPGVYAAATADLGHCWVVHYDDSKATQISIDVFDYLLDFTVERTSDPNDPTQPKNRGWMSYIAQRLYDYATLFKQTPQVTGTEVAFTSTQFADYDITNGVYIKIQSWNKTDDGSFPARADTLSITSNIDYIHSTIATHNPINPSAISGSSVYTNPNNAVNSGGITQTWVVTGPNGYTKTVTGDDIDSLLVYTGVGKLAAGDHTVNLLGSGETVNGTVVPDDYITGAETTFTVQYPAPTVTIDTTENPTNIVVAKEFTDSTYTWKVYEWDGSTETEVPGFLGTGGTADAKTTLDFERYKVLPVGSYRVRIIETDYINPEIIGESFGDFTIVGPLVVPALVGGFTTAPASPALPANPTSGTGTPKFLDSIVTWEIIDEGGSTTGITGTNATELESAFTNLPEGEYQLQYTETAPYNGLMHSASVSFQIINPLTSANVDVATNPTKGTGTQKLPDSTVTWEITTSTGTVLSGTGTSLTSVDFDKLPNGTYTLIFTETSEYNKHTYSASTTFEIVIAPADKPFTTTTVTGTKTPTGDIYNPTALTGTQKILSSALTWEIKDKDGKKVAEGSGAEVPKSVIDKLVEGPHTLFFTEKAVDGQTHASTGKFVIVKPNPTPTIDKPIDPESITAVPHIPDSSLTWEIKDPTGKVVVKGDGGAVPLSVINSLTPGSYEVAFTEHSLVPGLTAENSVTFTTTKKPITPVTPGGNTGGGSWNPSDWTNPNAGKNSNGDKSPNVLKSSGLKTPILSESDKENPSEDGNARNLGADSDTTNPQTGDTTNQSQVLTVLYVLLGVSLVILGANLMIPKKRKKQR